VRVQSASQRRGAFHHGSVECRDAGLTGRRSRSSGRLPACVRRHETRRDCMTRDRAYRAAPPALSFDTWRRRWEGGHVSARRREASAEGDRPPRRDPVGRHLLARANREDVLSSASRTSYRGECRHPEARIRDPPSSSKIRIRPGVARAGRDIPDPWQKVRARRDDLLLRPALRSGASYRFRWRNTLRSIAGPDHRRPTDLRRSFQSASP